MRAVSEGTRATAVAQGFSFAPALTLSSGRAFAAKDMRSRCKQMARTALVFLILVDRVRQTNLSRSQEPRKVRSRPGHQAV